MDKVMLVESLGFNLMSVSMLCDLNMIVIFGKYRCLVLMESDKSLVFEGYRRLGHAGMRNLHTLAKKKHIIDIEGVKFKKDHLCGACEAGKMTRAKHPSKTIMTTTQPF